MPARCQSSPSSEPPRRPATAHTPPASQWATATALYSGLIVMAKPPYPVRMVGVSGPGVVSARRNMRRPTSVPSVDG